MVDGSWRFWWLGGKYSTNNLDHQKRRYASLENSCSLGVQGTQGPKVFKLISPRFLYVVSVQTMSSFPAVGYKLFTLKNGVSFVVTIWKAAAKESEKPNDLKGFQVIWVGTWDSFDLINYITTKTPASFRRKAFNRFSIYPQQPLDVPFCLCWRSSQCVSYHHVTTKQIFDLWHVTRVNHLIFFHM